MKVKLYMPILGIATAGLLFSCVKDEIYNTPHPDKGAVVFLLEGLNLDEGYVVEIDGHTADMTATPFVYPDILAPGTYSVVIYNRADGFTFEGRTAHHQSRSDEGRADASPLIPQPEHLRTGCVQITVLPDDSLRVSPDVEQRTRDLNFELEITQGRPELIQSVTGTLTGVARSFDIEQNVTTGDAASIQFPFTRQGDKLTADVRLLGTMGAVQTLVLDIVFTDGGRTQRTEVALTEALADFDSDMTTAYCVTGTLETPVGMEEVSTEITGWETVEGGDASAEM